MAPDFSGWATKAGLKCSDGRTIMPDAFKDQDQAKVPLVWQHAHGEVANVLGHALLENRPEGVYAYGFFNDTDDGQRAKKVVAHGDITQLSIYANKLIEKSKSVLHGVIREVSLVLAGANPGAQIDFVAVQHGDGLVEELEDEAIIFTGLEITLEHSESSEAADATTDEVEEKEEDVSDAIQHADEKSVEDVFNTLSDDQKDVVYYMIGEALKGAAGKDEAAHSGLNIKATLDGFTEDQQNVTFLMISEALKMGEHEAAHADIEEKDDNPADAETKEGTSMTHNVFEGNAADGKVKTGTSLSHADQERVFKRALQIGSLRDALVEHLDRTDDTLAHGIDDIDVLFPDARNVTGTPEFISVGPSGLPTFWVAPRKRRSPASRPSLRT